jgi:hypothetical protein
MKVKSLLSQAVDAERPQSEYKAYGWTDTLQSDYSIEHP